LTAVWIQIDFESHVGMTIIDVVRFLIANATPPPCFPLSFLLCYFLLIKILLCYFIKI